LGMRPIAMPVHGIDDMEPAVKSFTRDRNGGLVVLSDAFNVVNRKLIIGLAAQYRLPAIYFFRFFVTDGGLVSYGVDRSDSFRRAAAYVDRILRGAKPADLPVEGPTKFELVVNLKTAKALGLDVPWFLQQRADEVIERLTAARSLRCSAARRAWPLAAGAPSLSLNICGPDHLAPGPDFNLDPLREFLWRARDRIVSERYQAFPHVRLANDHDD